MDEKIFSFIQFTFITLVITDMSGDSATASMRTAGIAGPTKYVSAFVEKNGPRGSGYLKLAGIQAMVMNYWTST